MLMHGKKTLPPGCGAGSRSGMTLLEVVIAIGLFSIMICAMLSLQSSTLETERLSTLQLNGTVALRSQMEETLVSAYDNMRNYSSIAQGLVSYLSEMSRQPGIGTLANVELVDSAIVYTFPVPEPGGALDAGASNLFRNAVGTLTIFLNETNVPGDFINWSTLYDNGSSQANGLSFDMNGDMRADHNYSNLFSGGELAISQSDLNSIPVQGEIRYYKSAEDLARNTPSYFVVRNFIVNGSVIGSMDDFLREF